MTDLWGEPMARHELLRRLGRLEQIAGIRLATLGDARELGVRVLEVRTGRLSFDIVVDRSFDIGRCDLEGTPIAWVSPAGPMGPWYAEQTELGWLRTFGGGLMATCGLDRGWGCVRASELQLGSTTNKVLHEAGRARCLCSSCEPARPRRKLTQHEDRRGDTGAARPVCS